MKLKIDKVIRERSNTFEDQVLCIVIICLILGSIICLFADKYTAPLSFFVSPKEITAGESLKKYNKYRVTCKVPYVINTVVDLYDSNLYDENDEHVEIYTHGYVGVDENFENPFFFYVSPERKAEVDRMMEETWKIVYGGEQKRDIGYMEIEGYVRVGKEKHMHYYEGALLDIYGNTEALQETGNKPYVLDDQNVLFGNGRSFPVFLELFLIFFLIIRGIPVFSRYMKNRNNGSSSVKKYLKKYALDKEELNQEFIGAEEIVYNHWVGRRFTFCLTEKDFIILRNREIVLVYATDNSFNCYTSEQRNYSFSRQDEERKYLLNYYEMNFPHVVVGMNEEIHRMIMTDFDAFLELKYRKN